MFTTAGRAATATVVGGASQLHDCSKAAHFPEVLRDEPQPSGIGRCLASFKNAVHPREFLQFPCRAEIRQENAEVIGEFLEAELLDGGMACAAWPGMLVKAFPELRGLPLATMLALLVERVFRNRADPSAPRRDCIEYFAGQAELTKAHLEIVGADATRWDRTYGEGDAHDCLASVGFGRWLDDLSFSAPGALIWFGTQCSSFLLMCKGKSERSRSNGFFGNTTREFVVLGNKQMLVTSLMYLIAWVVGCSAVLEQPLQSVLPKLQPLSTVLRFCSACRTITWLGSFNGDSSKPIQLWHTNHQYSQLKRPCPSLKFKDKLLVTRWVQQQSGRKRFRGNSRLKKSQHYTVEFGRAVAVITRAALAGVRL